MDNFKLIYKILKYFEACMEFEEFDEDNFTAAHFGVSDTLFLNILNILIEDGYIRGVKVINDKLGSQLLLLNPHLSLEGMEYLENNTMMKKVYRTLKGINDIIPKV